MGRRVAALGPIGCSRWAYPSQDREWKSVAQVRTVEKTGRDIYVASLSGTAEPTALLQGAHSEDQPALSPDGLWLAYTSDESGAPKVYLTRLPDGQSKWQVSTAEGVFAAWSPDGKRLYFVGPDITVYEVELTTEPRVMLTPPRAVLDGSKLGVDPYIGFNLTADGKSMVFIRSADTDGAQAIGVIENWFTEFQNRR
ncbi:MAG: PD40 domain-containing protein [Planctomycetes bacterium]|nr:PD40 domain-containing protein [Planctomycetota bacterium]